jgi:hypothetical protein
MDCMQGFFNEQPKESITKLKFETAIKKMSDNL